MRMMMLLRLHVVNDDDEKKIQCFIDVSVSVPNVVDVVALSLS
jgi:hypothetical protein